MCRAVVAGAISFSFVSVNVTLDTDLVKLFSIAAAGHRLAELMDSSERERELMGGMKSDK